MPPLTIYGDPISRTFRTFWMAHELGLEYENVPVNPRNGETREDAYLAINPNGHVPSIRDGDLVLWESLAINIYLAMKHPGPLTPATVEDEALAIQWSMWALTEAETASVTLIQNHMRPEDKRDAAAVDAAKETLAAPLGVLDRELAQREWLLGEEFTVANLNVAAVLSTLPRVEYDLGPYPAVAAWLTACLSRPAAQQARELRADAQAAQ